MKMHFDERFKIYALPEIPRMSPKGGLFGTL